MANSSSQRYAIALVALCATLTLAACKPDGEPSPAVQPTLEECPPPFAVVAGFSAQGTVRLPGGGPASTSTTLVDGEGNRIVVQSGDLGDFMDSPAEGHLALADGGRGYLFMIPGGWGFFWTEDGPCHQHSASATGLTRSRFLRLLARAGVIAPPP